MEPAVGEGAVELPALAGRRLAGEVIEWAPVDVAQDKEDGKGAIGIAADVDRPVDFGEGAEKRGVAIPNAERAGRRGGAEGLRVDPGHEPRSARELAVVEAAHALAEPFDALLPVGERLPVGGDKVDDRGTDRVDRVAAIPGGEARRLLAIGCRCGGWNRHHQAGKRHPGRKRSDRSVDAGHLVSFPRDDRGQDRWKAAQYSALSSATGPYGVARYDVSRRGSPPRSADARGRSAPGSRRVLRGSAR